MSIRGKEFQLNFTTAFLKRKHSHNACQSAMRKEAEQSVVIATNRLRDNFPVFPTYEERFN